MKRNGLKPESLIEHRGEQMLAGVLLHVIEAASPVEGALHRPLAKFLVNDMNDFALVIADVENFCVADAADVIGLAAGSGIERGLIQDHFPRGNCSGRRGERRSRQATQDARAESL